MVFNITTKFRLLEYLDHDNYLLRKVATETPATYTHTLMVMALSEKAVRAIKGNVLLTRVGCLYNDIGKTKNPLFFAENKYLDESAEEFKAAGPLKSAKIITNHVVDGIKLAHIHKLPKEIIDFIPEHHGTTTIQYFYHQALEENKLKQKQARKNKSKKVTIKEVDKKDFQYPGPKPRSRETAIVMIADSLEAAVRSIENPSYEAFSDMIERIIENKLAENQFDECNLTFQDLKIAKEAFIEFLLSATHLRPKYPHMQDTKKLEEEITEKFTTS